MFVPTVPAVLLDQLAAARGAGVPFHHAWPGALETAVRAAASPLQRERWHEALEATRSAWREAFLRRPAKPRELALAIATEGLGSKARPSAEANERAHPVSAAA